MKVGRIIDNLEKPCKIVLKCYLKDGKCLQYEKVHNRGLTFVLFRYYKVLDCRKISYKHYEIICRHKQKWN